VIEHHPFGMICHGQPGADYHERGDDPEPPDQPSSVDIAVAEPKPKSRGPVG
jgi:hypothetical protein